MVTTVKWVIGLIVCLVLQTTLVPSMAIFGIQPDLLLILLFLLAVRYGVMPGIYAGFLLGLGLDLYSPSLLGQNALAATIMGFFAGLFNEKVMRTDPIMKVVILVACLLLHDAVFAVVEVVKTDSSLGSLFLELIARSIPRAAYSTAVAFLIYAWSYFVKLGRGY